MIDLSNGEVEFFGIKVTPNSKLSDYYNCDPQLVNINEFGPGRGVVRIKEPYLSNNIRAFIKIGFETEGVVNIIIDPEFDVLPKVDSTLLPALTVELSKKWLRGMTVNGEYKERSESICGDYDWGNIDAHVMWDRDYGTNGGWIEIEYER